VGQPKVLSLLRRGLYRGSSLVSSRPLILLSAGALWAAGEVFRGLSRTPAAGVRAGRQVTLTNISIKTVYMATSDAKGVYTFPIFQWATNDIKFEAAGFSTQTRADVTVNADDAVRWI